MSTRSPASCISKSSCSTSASAALPISRASDKFKQNPYSNSEESDCDDKNYTRLWIGNLDPKLTEFHLLKLIQRFGPIDNFDFLFHRSGPNAGLPRGYAFVTFKDTPTAQKCINTLNGKRILEKMVAVRWAHQTTFTYPDEEEKIRRMLPALGMKSEPEKSQSKEKTISAIEAKLRAMERDTLNFHLSNTNSPVAGGQRISVPSTSYAEKYQNLNSNFANSSAAFGRFRCGNTKNKPYERNAQRRK